MIKDIFENFISDFTTLILNGIVDKCSSFNLKEGN